MNTAVGVCSCWFNQDRSYEHRVMVGAVQIGPESKPRQTNRQRAIAVIVLLHPVN